MTDYAQVLPASLWKNSHIGSSIRETPISLPIQSTTSTWLNPNERSHS
ncbi:hypothetical protein [Chroococcidiopsis sp. SAG 2025]|nr:hypothetical protein [Chroococcidiopsis sp. SAG 2025]